MKKKIAVLGSTGSIGTQVLEVVSQNPDLFQIEVLTAHNNADLLIKQALKYEPNVVVIANDEKYDYVSDALDIKGIKVFAHTNLNSKFGKGSGFSSSTTRDNQNLNLAISIAPAEISTQ